MNKAVLVVLVAVVGCRKAAPAPREAHAVGTYMGGGSVLFGPSSCTYDAPPAVAEFSFDGARKPFMAKLVGPGTISETCAETKTVYDVLKPTAARIAGPMNWKVGDDTFEYYEFIPMAGTRDLRGVHQGGEEPAWSLGKNCDGVATFAPVLGAQDTGGHDVWRRLVATKSGQCTISAALLGVRATKTVLIL